MPTLKIARLDIDRLQRLIDVIEVHVRAKRLNDAREALREARALKIKIANRLCIENYIQTKSTRAMH